MFKTCFVRVCVCVWLCNFKGLPLLQQFLSLVCNTNERTVQMLFCCQDQCLHSVVTESRYAAHSEPSGCEHTDDGSVI